MEPRPARRRVLVALALGVPVSLVFGVLAFHNADPAGIGDALRKARPAQLAAAVGAFAAMYLLQAVRWRIVAATPHVPLGRFTAMVVGAIAVNNVLPGRVGDVLRGRWLGREAGIPSGRALATVVLDRGGDVVALTLLLGLAVTQTDVPRWLRGVGLGAALAVLLIVGGIVCARLYTGRRARARRARGRLRTLGRDVLDGLSEPLGVRRAVAALALSVGSWLCFALAALLVGRSVGIHLGAADAVLVASVVNLGVAIPSSPGFVGTYQWLVVESVALVAATTREQALAVAILLHAAWYVPTTLVGGVAMLARLGGLRAAAARDTASPTRPAP